MKRHRRYCMSSKVPPNSPNVVVIRCTSHVTLLLFVLFILRTEFVQLMHVTNFIA